MNNNNQMEQIQKKLQDIPPRMLLIQSHPFSGRGALSFSEHFPSQKNEKGRIIVYSVYPGIELSFHDYLAEQNTCCHEASDDILEINYCRLGRSGWNMKDGSTIYLGARDFSVHTQKLCSGSVMAFPNGYYSGLAICIHLKQLSKTPPELLREAGITGETLYQKLCARDGFTTLAGSEKTEAIFNGFYELPEPLRLAYFKLKTQELLLYLYRAEISESRKPSRYQPEQIETIKKVHDQLTQKLNERITIEALSKQFLMNPSTMKALFKAVYGNSIAAHIKEHRMEKAALLLQNTSDSIGCIAKAVGYDSQSKFSAEFKKIYQLPPAEYRKLHP